MSPTFIFIILGTGVSIYPLYILQFLLFSSSCCHFWAISGTVSPSILIHLLSIILSISYLISKQNHEKMDVAMAAVFTTAAANRRKYLSSRSLGRLEVKPGIQTLESKLRPSGSWQTQTTSIPKNGYSVPKYVNRITPPPSAGETAPAEGGGFKQLEGHR